MASVFITANFNTPIELNKKKVEKIQSIKEEYGTIPFVIEDNKIFLFSTGCLEINTKHKSVENNFIFQFFEGIGGYHLGVPNSDVVSKNLLKELYELFEEIQLDVSMTESYAGETVHIDVRVNSKGEFICKTEAPMWICEECDEENEDDLSSCWSCETERVYVE